MRERRSSFYISNGDAEKRMAEISKRKALIPISKLLTTIQEGEEDEENEDKENKEKEDEREINHSKESGVTDAESMSDIHIAAMMVDEELEDRKDIGSSNSSKSADSDADMFNDFEYMQEQLFINGTGNENVAAGGMA
jgi:hypothetical protein